MLLVHIDMVGKKHNMKTINFYSHNAEYGYFSNFSPHSVQMLGKIWPTSEHYYQAMKFSDPEYQEQIRQAKNAYKCKELGNARHISFKKDWADIMDDVMREVVYAKFTQHLDLRQNLLDTNDDILVEHTVNDKYWGDGGDGSGKNMLGKVLMEVRTKIKMDNLFA